MKKQPRININDLLKSESAELQELNAKVQQAIQDEEILTRNLGMNTAELTTGEKIADKVASFGGSWTFIITFGVFLLLWIVGNTILLSSKSFDPYPFILLNLILSCIAAIQAPVIMMSQNRKEEKDRQRAENDYLINLKAEIEIRNLHNKLDWLISEQLKHLMEIQQLQIEKLEKMEKELKKEGSK